MSPDQSSPDDVRKHREFHRRIRDRPEPGAIAWFRRARFASLDVMCEARGCRRAYRCCQWPKSGELRPIQRAEPARRRRIQILLLGRRLSRSRETRRAQSRRRTCDHLQPKNARHRPTGPRVSSVNRDARTPPDCAVGRPCTGEGTPFAHRARRPPASTSARARSRLYRSRPCPRGR